MLSTVARTVARTSTRGIHTSKVARSGHGEYHHLPFAWPHGKRSIPFGVKLSLMMATGFALPFIAGGYQLKKSQGGA